MEGQGNKEGNWGEGDKKRNKEGKWRGLLMGNWRGDKAGMGGVYEGKGGERGEKGRKR